VLIDGEEAQPGGGKSWDSRAGGVWVVVGGARREKNKRISRKRLPVAHRFWLPVAH
jgi:hypothetical protein